MEETFPTTHEQRNDQIREILHGWRDEHTADPRRDIRVQIAHRR